MQRAKLALSCLSAIAASLLVASVVPAAGEHAAVELDDHQMGACESGVTLAALNVLGSEQSESEYTIDPVVPNTIDRIVLSAEHTIIGIASFYDDPQKTASGEQYDPSAFTAAAQLEIRGRFGGIQFGRLYRPAYGLGEYGGKKIIVRFNDVGPLRPGRKFDLSRAAMSYFDGSLVKGLLPDFKMTPLPLGRSYPEGPVTDLQLAALGIDDAGVVTAYAAAVDEPQLIHTNGISQPKPPAREAARSKKSKSASTLRVRAKVAAARMRAKATAARMRAKAAAARLRARTAAVIVQGSPQTR